MFRGITVTSNWLVRLSVRLTTLAPSFLRLGCCTKNSLKPFWFVLISPIEVLNLDTSAPTTVHDGSAWTSRDSSSGPAYQTLVDTALASQPRHLGCFSLFISFPIVALLIIILFHYTNGGLGFISPLKSTHHRVLP